MVLWPATAMKYLMLPVLATILAGIPIGAAMFRIATRLADDRARRLASPGPPVARIHRDGDQSSGGWSSASGGIARERAPA